MSLNVCVALPFGAMGLSAVCDCGISDHSDLLFFVSFYQNKIMNTKVISSLHLSNQLTKSLFRAISQASITLSVSLYVCLSVCLSVYLSVCLEIFPSVD